MSDDVLPAQSEESSSVEDELIESPQEYRITGKEIVPRASDETSFDDTKLSDDSILDEAEDEVEQSVDEEPMDWEDLTREQWSETDRLLQKVERVGSKVLQRDFLSTVGKKLFR